MACNHTPFPPRTIFFLGEDVKVFAVLTHAEQRQGISGSHGYLCNLLIGSGGYLCNREGDGGICTYNFGAG